MDVRGAIGEVREGFREHDLLTAASAIAFQVLTALVPLALFTLALAGFLDLDRVWRDAAAQLRPRVSGAAFQVVDDTVRDVIGGRRPLWLTVGAALALWRLSSAMRAIMGTLDVVYGAREQRPFARRVAISLALSVEVLVLVLAALAVVNLGPVVVPVEGFALHAASVVVRWGIAAGLLLLAMGLVIRHAPAAPQPIGWVSLGTVLAMAAWLAASAGFALYVTSVADYSTLFGSFTTVFLLLAYLYTSAVAFLAGVEVDTLVRRRAGAV
jgi:membrane protein